MLAKYSGSGDGGSSSNNNHKNKIRSKSTEKSTSSPALIYLREFSASNRKLIIQFRESWVNFGAYKKRINWNVWMFVSEYAMRAIYSHNFRPRNTKTLRNFRKRSVRISMRKILTNVPKISHVQCTLYTVIVSVFASACVYSEWRWFD